MYYIYASVASDSCKQIKLINTFRQTARLRQPVADMIITSDQWKEKYCVLINGAQRRYTQTGEQNIHNEHAAQSQTGRASRSSMQYVQCGL